MTWFVNLAFMIRRSNGQTQNSTRTHSSGLFPLLMWWSLAGNSHFLQRSHLFSGILPHPWFMANKSRAQKYRGTDKEEEETQVKCGKKELDSGLKTDVSLRCRGQICLWIKDQDVLIQAERWRNIAHCTRYEKKAKGQEVKQVVFKARLKTSLNLRSCQSLHIK